VCIPPASARRDARAGCGWLAVGRRVVGAVCGVAVGRVARVCRAAAWGRGPRGRAAADDRTAGGGRGGRLSGGACPVTARLHRRAGDRPAGIRAAECLALRAAARRTRGRRAAGCMARHDGGRGEGSGGCRGGAAAVHDRRRSRPGTHDRRGGADRADPQRHSGCATRRLASCGRRRARCVGHHTARAHHRSSLLHRRVLHLLARLARDAACCLGHFWINRDPGGEGVGASSRSMWTESSRSTATRLVPPPKPARRRSGQWAGTTTGQSSPGRPAAARAHVAGAGGSVGAAAGVAAGAFVARAGDSLTGRLRGRDAAACRGGEPGR
jgi:hypothetical protein